jgi:alkylation response protein AidB-like acyl-CoA dehydrogenase
MVAGSAVQKLMQTLAKEQEVLMNIADIAIWIYQAESVLLRVEKMLQTKNASEIQREIAIAKLYFYDTADRIEKAAKDAIFSFAEGDEAKMMLSGLKRFTKTDSINPKALRQLIAEDLINRNKYE